VSRDLVEKRRIDSAESLQAVEIELRVGGILIVGEPDAAFPSPPSPPMARMATEIARGAGRPESTG
jgi:hypothetical protein